MPSSKIEKQGYDSPSPPTRLKHARIIEISFVALILIISIFSYSFVTKQNFNPGDPLFQISATIGIILLFAPVFFTVMKRSTLISNPPRWFAIHVVASMIGAIFISLHVSAGNIFSIPGFLFFLLIIIMLQGVYSRVYISKSFSSQFGTRENSFYISTVDKSQLKELIIDKKKVLVKLDKDADEALFSPNLNHAFRHPLLTLKYIALTSRESRIVGARRRAGIILSMWRPLHITMAILFIFGAIIHIIVVIFFAGYVAGDDSIYWWHLAAWGNGK